MGKYILGFFISLSSLFLYSSNFDITLIPSLRKAQIIPLDEHLEGSFNKKIYSHVLYIHGQDYLFPIRFVNKGHSDNFEFESAYLNVIGDRRFKDPMEVKGDHRVVLSTRFIANAIRHLLGKAE